MNNFLEKLKRNIPIPKSIRFDRAGVDIGSDHIRHIMFDYQYDGLSIKSFGVEKLSSSLDKKNLLSENDSNNLICFI